MNKRKCTTVAPYLSHDMETGLPDKAGSPSGKSELRSRIFRSTIYIKGGVNTEYIANIKKT